MKSTFLIHLSSLILLIATAAGYEMYNTKNHTCCKGKLHPKSTEEGSQQGCCGDQPRIYHYGPNNYWNQSFCCDGQTHYSLNSSDYCCGKKLIKNHNFGCINGSETVEIPESEKLKGNTGVCGKSIDEMTFFDKNRNVCCDGVLYEKNLTGYSYCLGSQYISYHTHAECFQYNIETQKIEITALPLEGRNELVTRCCNNELYDMDNQVCLNKKVYNIVDVIPQNCCGFTYTYNASIHRWTEVINENGSDDEDCDELILIGEEFSCYRNKVIQVALLSQNHSLCTYDLSLYDTNTQTCYSGGVRNLTDDEMQNGNRSYCEDNFKNVDENLILIINNF